MQNNYPITDFDLITLPESIQMFKAMIPFMDYRMQKTCSMIIRANELTHTMNYYKNSSKDQIIKACNCTQSITYNTSIDDILSNKELIQSVLTYCPENIASIIKNYNSFSKMSDIFNVMNKFDTGSSQSVSDLLNSDQKKLYNEYLNKLSAG